MAGGCRGRGSCAWRGDRRTVEASELPIRAGCVAAIDGCLFAGGRDRGSKDGCGLEPDQARRTVSGSSGALPDEAHVGRRSFWRHGTTGDDGAWHDRQTTNGSREARESRKGGFEAREVKIRAGAGRKRA